LLPGSPAPRPPRLLVAGIGYSNLRDLSAGPALAERLRSREWPAGVEVEDLSLGAVLALHWLQANGPFDAALFLAAVPRGREPGSVDRYTWAPDALSAEDVQARVAEAVTGVVSLDNLLAVAGYFRALPAQVQIIEIEPRDQEWGPDFSPPVAVAMDAVEAMVQREVRV